MKQDKHHVDSVDAKGAEQHRRTGAETCGMPACAGRSRPETKGVNELSYSVTERPLVRGVGWVGGILALGLLVGMSAIFWTASSASAAPDGPEKVFALTDSDNLLRFDGDNPRMDNKKKITGLVGGESLVGIDFRPSAQAPNAAQQGALYGIGDQGYIYTIDPMTAVATRGARITADGLPFALRGTSFGIDFNPTVDRLRIVSNDNQNLRVNVDTGALADFDPNTPGTQPDGDLQYGAGDPNVGTDPDVTSVAYRNSRAAAFGTTNTELYDIDPATDDMSEQTPPNNGTLVTEGMLGRDVNRLAGFDIVTVGDSPAGDEGYAALQTRMNSVFYKVNLGNGQTAPIGRIGGPGTDVVGLAIPIGQR